MINTPPSASSTLRADLVQHLMDEGQAPIRALTELTSYSLIAVRNVLLHLRQAGLVVRTKSRDEAGYSLPLFALRRAGIEAALAVQSKAV